MSFPAVYLSRPAITLPEERFDNEQIISLIKGNYRGETSAWQEIEASIRKVLELCNTEHRYLDLDETHRVADYACRCCESCLKDFGIEASQLDMLIYGGIAREYFEPATAMEVAGKLGASEIHAFDVTSACAGLLEGVQIAASYLGMRDEYDYAMVCSAELTRNFLSFDIQRPEELIHKVAGLTIGNAAAAWMVSRNPSPGGGLKLLEMENYSLPENWALCSAPIDGSFTSFSQELFKLNVHVAPQLQRMMDRLGWKAEDIDHFVFHQPSESIVYKVLSDLGADTSKAVLSHHLYANTSSTTVPLAMHRLLELRKPKPGDKFLLSTAAAGFTIVSAAGEWVEQDG